MLKLVAEKLAIVTGAGSGIGRATCLILAREGAKVIATDQNIKAAEETVNNLEGTGHIALNMQVNDRESVETAFRIIVKQYSKPPTIIVNSAGILRNNSMVELSDANFDDVIDVNLKGTFLVMQTAVKAMIEANVTKDSSIINISSVSGKYPNLNRISNYSASKAGVIAMTKCAATEFGKYGIRVNAVLPGLIETPMVSHMPDEAKKQFLTRVPLRRVGKPEEVAEVIVFLASDRSSYINAASIEVTGGIC